MKNYFQRFLKESVFLRYYLWKYKKLVAIGLFCILVVDLLDLIPPLLLQSTIDHLTQTGFNENSQLVLLEFAIAYFSISILQAIGRYGWRIFLIRTSMMSGRDLRERFAKHLFSLSTSFFQRHRSGDLMALATNDTEAVRMALGAGMITFADAAFYLLTIPIAMFWLSPELTLLSSIPLFIIPWIVIKFERQIHERFKKTQISFGKLAAASQENLAGMKVIKSFAKEPVVNRRFTALSQEFLDLNLKLARSQSALGPLLDFVMSLCMVFLIYWAGGLVIENSLSIGTFVAFQRYLQKLIWPLSALGYVVTFYQKAVASSKRIDDILQEFSDIVESPQIKTSVNYSPITRRAPGEILIKNLAFSYSPNGSKILKNINLHIAAGENIGLIGPVGSGKTTLLSLLARLYPVEDDKIFIDGLDINQWDLKILRDQIGFVTQDVFLFSHSLVENITFGIEDFSAEENEIVENALRTSAMLNEAKSFQEGFHTRVGERGGNLSGGQKQRLTLARAITKNPSLLILDDALSAVDVETEKQVLTALKDENKKRTCIMCSHRLSSVLHADKIIVLEAGEITQQGTHQELIRQDGYYRKQYFKQSREKALKDYVQRLEV